jgi:hypothetical protein
MPAEWADTLEDAGYDDLDSLLNSSVEDLTAIDGVDAEMAARMIELSRKHEQIGEDEPAEEEEAESEDGEEPAEAENPEEAQVE